MSTAIVAHADRDGIAASVLLLRHREPSGRVYPVGRAQDIASLLSSCSGKACPDKMYIIGYHSMVSEDTWAALHRQNPRIFWFDHHVDKWADVPMPPSDMVRVFLPAEGERNAPAAMVARFVFGDVAGVPAEDRDFLRRIYEALPADEVVDFIDGLHAEMRGVQYTEMTDFIKAVIHRRIPPHYQHFLKTARAGRKNLLKFLSGGKNLVKDGRVVKVSEIGEFASIPRPVLSIWLRDETGTRISILDLGKSIYVNMRHDVRLDLRKEIKSVDGFSCEYISGHPYAVYADGCAMEDGSNPSSAVFSRLSARLGEKS